jgi:N6-adenosine-specific RNA methylase IME4
MTQLIKYDAACRAIAAAKHIDEVKKIRDVSIAMKAYARQAKNHTMEEDAIEIRMRATRRMDQMRQGQKATIGLAKGSKGKGRPPLGGLKNNPPKNVPTLADAGIDKNLAHEGRKLGALTDREFEKAIKSARSAVGSVVKTALRTDDKAERRAERERELAKATLALPDRKFNVILADPEWRFEPWSRQTGMDRAPYYPTSCTEVIAARDVPSIAAKNCALFLCATAPMLPHALLVMAAWGFDYVTNWELHKNRVITGYWNRNRHEHLLLGVRGTVPCPAPGEQWESVIEMTVGRHSEKPEAIHEMIEAYFPNLPKIELNRRGAPRPGWDAWGNEVVREAAE